MTCKSEEERLEYFKKVFEGQDFLYMNGSQLLSLASKFEKIEELYLNSNRETLITKKIAILASYTSHHLIKVLKLFLYYRKINPIFYESEYNSIVPELMDPNSRLYGFSPNVILILTGSFDIRDYPNYFASTGELDRWIENKTAHYQNLWKNAAEIPGCQVFQTNFVTPVSRPLGMNLEINSLSSPSNSLIRLNIELIKSKPQNVTLIDMEYIASYFGKKDWFDYPNYFLSKQGFSFNAYSLVCNSLSRVLASHFGIIRKCLVLDLDNTLWGGVIGDDGLEGINIDPHHPVGEAFLFFQTYIKKLKERGVILAVCSKNEDKIARQPFQDHPDMVLSEDDISCFIANWNDKPSNIRQIAKELNIGLDSLVFFDDNPFERDIVKKFISEVEVVDVPEDPAEYVPALNNTHCFEWVQLTEEDVNRSDSYIANKKREKLSLTASDYDSYLKALEMEAVIGNVTPVELPRFSQLINKSNQFNLRTQRYSEKEISEMMDEKDEYSLVYVSLSDIYSHYGIISCLILRKSENIAFIDTWVMSCRVLKRGVECFVFNEICDIARNWGCEKIIGEYIPTKKNHLVSGLLREMGLAEKKNVVVPRINLIGEVFEADLGKETGKVHYLKRINLLN